MLKHVRGYSGCCCWDFGNWGLPRSIETLKISDISIVQMTAVLCSSELNF